MTRSSTPSLRAWLAAIATALLIGACGDDAPRTDDRPATAPAGEETPESTQPGRDYGY